jgi:hypothetical protein
MRLEDAMRRIVRTGSLVLALLALGRTLEAQHQWGLGVDVGLTRFWGASEAVPPDNSPGLKPYRPTSVALRVDRIVGRARVGLGVAYGTSGIGAETENAAVIAKGTLSWVQLAPEFAYRLAILGAGPELRAFGGPVGDLWLPEAEDGRFRLGARGGFELLAPLGTRVAATVRAHGGVTGSLFRDDEVPSGYRTKTMPNAGVALGFRLGL